MSTATLRSESEPMARIDRAIEPLLDGQLIYYMGSPGTTNTSSRLLAVSGRSFDVSWENLNDRF